VYRLGNNLMVVNLSEVSKDYCYRSVQSQKTSTLRKCLKVAARSKSLSKKMQSRGNNRKDRPSNLYKDSMGKL
jgi:hypothetical protein